jgi:hypothetical protein
MVVLGYDYVKEVGKDSRRKIINDSVPIFLCVHYEYPHPGNSLLKLENEWYLTNSKPLENLLCEVFTVCCPLKIIHINESDFWSRKPRNSQPTLRQKLLENNWSDDVRLCFQSINR